MIPDRLRHYLEYAGVMCLTLPWYYLPRKITLTLGAWLGWNVAHLIPVRRQVVQSNLTRAFPEKSGREIRKLVIQTYRHFGKVAGEFARQDRYSSGDLQKFVVPENVDILDTSMNHGRGVVLLLGHFGNWELLAYWLGQMGYPTVALHRPQENPLVDRLISVKRTAGNLQMLPTSESVTGMLSALDQEKILLILADQDARGSGNFVDFFNIPSSTFRGAAVFAQRRQSPIILAFPVIQSDHTYRFIFEELRYSGNGNQDSVQQILQQYMYRLQHHVRQHPEQYFWFHRRWKTQPKKQEASETTAPRWIGAGAAG